MTEAEKAQEETAATHQEQLANLQPAKPSPDTTPEESYVAGLKREKAMYEVGGDKKRAAEVQKELDRLKGPARAARGKTTERATKKAPEER